MEFTTKKSLEISDWKFSIKSAISKFPYFSELPRYGNPHLCSPPKRVNTKHRLELYKPDLVWHLLFSADLLSHSTYNLLSFTASDLLISLLKGFPLLVYLFPALPQSCFL